MWLEGRVEERNKECASSEDIVALVEKLYLMSLIFWYKCFIFEKRNNSFYKITHIHTCKGRESQKQKGAHEHLHRQQRLLTLLKWNDLDWVLYRAQINKSTFKIS